jgi:prepilin-type N-terminal cleavage/methylation domain-containing protein
MNVSLRRHAAGFTLIELLVVMGILTGFLLMLAQLVDGGLRLFGEGELGQALADRTSAAQRRVTAELSLLRGAGSQRDATQVVDRLVVQELPLGLPQRPERGITKAQVLRGAVRLPPDRELPLLDAKIAAELLRDDPKLTGEELDKRIQELKAVLFWLEQNGTALKATIQALEVQKMTLVALKGMNVSLQDMAQAFSVKAPPAPSAGSAAAAPAQAPAEPPAAEPPAKPRRRAAKARAASPANAASAAPGPVDPMQWWGALTQQFQQIAQAAVADAQSRKSTDAPAQTGAASPAPKPARKGQAAKPRKAL